MAGELAENVYIYNEATQFANRANCRIHIGKDWYVTTDFKRYIKLQADFCTLSYSGAAQGAVLRGMGVKMSAPTPFKEFI
jgi:hypothetical protein